MECDAKHQLAYAPHGAEACGATIHAIGRLLFPCAPAHRSLCDDLEELGRWAAGAHASRHAAVAAGLAAQHAAGLAAGLTDLDDGVFFGLASFLDPTSLGSLDAACRQLRELNRARGGPWYLQGLRAYRGLELDGDGIFELPGLTAGNVGLRPPRVDWKSRCGRFLAEVPTFRPPFDGKDIVDVRQADEIAYCRCRLRSDLLDDAAAGSSGCVYMEVDVIANPDNVSLAVVDFEANGCSSVTFSPDTGAVIRERKVCETPRKVEGSYIQPLTTTTPGHGFEGSMGLLLHRGHLAFFRRSRVAVEGGEPAALGPWESTGFVTDLSWAEGRRLTPCLAFRNEGTYQIHMTRVNSVPPVFPQRNAMAYEDANWSSLDWDADQEEPEDVGT